MLHAISWTDYLQFILYSVLLYYAIILALFFRGDIRFYFLRFQPGISRHSSYRNNGIDDRIKGQAQNNELLTSAQILVAALKQLFSNAARHGYPKEELIMALQIQLLHYGELGGTAFEIAINNQIIQQANTECGIVLEETELKNLWGPKALPGDE